VATGTFLVHGEVADDDRRGVGGCDERHARRGGVAARHRDGVTRGDVTGAVAGTLLGLRRRCSRHNRRRPLQGVSPTGRGGAGWRGRGGAWRGGRGGATRLLQLLHLERGDVDDRVGVDLAPGDGARGPREGGIIKGQVRAPW
jgi:hypothetical protein